MKQQPGTGSVEHLVLIVGSNPYPNFLTAKLLQPAHVHLVFTEQTRPVMERLRSAIEPFCTVHADCYVTDAASALEIRRAVMNLPRGAWLNYTGGTKAMAVHVYQAWREQVGDSGRAIYVDDRNGKIRFDDGPDELPLAVDADLDLKTIATLHGKADLRFVEQPPREKWKQARPLAEDLARQRPEDIPEWKAKVRNSGCEIAKDVWLEYFTGASLVEAGVRPDRIYHSVKRHRCGKKEVELEVDVIALHGHRLHVLSASTAKDLDDCKLKLFEVAMRARQLGGDLARYGLVCLQYGDGLETLRKDVESNWDTPSPPRVFGFPDIQEWAGNALLDPDVSSLSAWLRGK